MDDRTWKLAVWTLAAAVFAVMLDAALGEAFEVPSGFWAVLPAMLGFLGALSAYRGRNGRNGK